jgi:hypothetical protein
VSQQQLISGSGVVHPINGYSDDVHLPVFHQQIVPVSIGAIETGINDSVRSVQGEKYEQTIVFLLVDMTHPATMSPVIVPSFRSAGDFDITTAQAGWQTVDVAQGYPPQTFLVPYGAGATPNMAASPLEGWVTQ